jgi:hypothetical protein
MTMVRVGQRYVLAAGAFAAAALWTGVGIVAGFECLLAFVAVALTVAAVQRRNDVVARRARSSQRGRRDAPRTSRELSTSEWPARPRSFDDDPTGSWQRAGRSDW